MQKSIFGAVGLGLLSSACCTLPLLAVTAGVGGAWATTFSWVEPYRWWFVGAAGLFLGFAAIREITESRKPDCDCDDGISARARRTLLVVAAIATAGLAMSPTFLKAEEATASAVAPSGERIVLAIEGMTCETCTTTVRTLLSEVDGASVVSVTYEPPHATVDVDPEKVDSEDLIEAVRTVGYDASVVWESPAER